MEAGSVTGPAKNLIEFAQRAAQPQPGLPRAEVCIATYQRGAAGAPSAFLDAVRSAGLEALIIPERFAFDPGVVFRLRAAAAERQPDIVQSHNVKSHFLVRLARIHRGRRWIAFQHGYTWPDLKMQIYNHLDRWSLPAADQVVAVCRPFAERLERIGVARERIAIRHNTVRQFTPAPPEKVAELRCALGVPPGALVIFCAGRLSREKGHVDLIGAVATLRERPHPPFRLVLAGEGPERWRIEEAMREYHVSRAVILTGHQEDLTPYYSMADLMALPSHSEGSPNVLLEGMAAGLAAAATAVGGVAEIAADGETALLVDKKNPADLAYAIGRLLDDEPLRKRLGAAAREAALAFRPEAYCESILRMYERLLLRTEACPCASR